MSRLRSNWRRLVVAAVLTVQVVTVAYARTTDTRYLAWAPYDQISFYELDVEVDGEALSAEEIVGRYSLRLWLEEGAARGRENRSIAHVLTYVQRAEADATELEIVIRASVNGRPVEVHTWSR
ncbi:MAG: hypothetical protein AAGE98_09320 [Actinomycetota bacterium]